MPASYSKDFRDKVMVCVKNGHTIAYVASKFEIAYNTVKNWCLRQENEGHYLAKKVGGKKGRVTKEELFAYITKNPNCTLVEIGKNFKMTSVGAYYTLKKFGYTYKKKSAVMWKQTRRREKNT